ACRSLTRRTIHESARDQYRGRSADQAIHARIVALRGRGETIANTARLAGTSVTTVKRVWAAYCALGHGH
ncbi:helix-turn-helix domain-containing protein, partial [Xanthomonas vasicola]|uniref:helix-turn-helix domain-containing protein n=1 Tax=Xanthomonas vasicola TaxID=56459 RepID=UPI001FEE8530